MKNIFRIIALLEGVSYLFLLFISVPIKYLYDNEFYVKLLGMPHGILFILYILIAYKIKKSMRWNMSTFMIVIIASLIPFGTFYIDRRYLLK